MSNTWSGVGRLGRDPEIKYFESGKVLAEFSMACDGNGKDKPPLWMTVKVWGKAAEFVGNYFSKGDPVFVSGHLESETWNDKNTGQQRSKIVCVGTVSFVPKVKELEENSGESQQQAVSSSTQTVEAYEDIPF